MAAILRLDPSACDCLHQTGGLSSYRAIKDLLQTAGRVRVEREDSPYYSIVPIDWLLHTTNPGGRAARVDKARAAGFKKGDRVRAVSVLGLRKGAEARVVAVVGRGIGIMFPANAKSGTRLTVRPEAIEKVM